MNEGMFPAVTSGVLLGIAGAAFLEFAKTVLAVTLSGLPDVEAQGYALVVYALTFVVALTLAGLAVGSSAMGFALYALPMTLFAAVTTLVMLLGATYLGWFGAADAVDRRPLWRAIAMFGASLLLLAMIGPLRREYGRLLSPIAQRFRPLLRWVTDHATWTVAVAGVALMILGGILGR